MWRSIGDKFDVENHNEGKHPRKIRTNIFSIFVLIILFLNSSYSVNERLFALIEDAAVVYAVKITVVIVLISLITVFFLLKFKKNNKEVDMLLLLLILMSLFTLTII